MRQVLVTLLLIFVSTPAISCNSKAPESIIRAMVNGEQVVGKDCSELPDEACICFDGIDLQDSEYVDNLVVDFVRKEQESSCLDDSDCTMKFSQLICERGQAIKNLESMSVYCAVEMMKKDGKKLVNSKEKKQARELAEKALREARKKEVENKSAAMARLKNFEPKGSTIGALKIEFKQLVDDLKEILK